MSKRIPKYRHHRPSGQAVVTLGGKDHYLGRWQSPESQAEYDRLVGEWLAAGRRPVGSGSPAGGSGLSLSEVLLAYWHHA